MRRLASTGTPVYAEINLGEVVCVKLKNLYFREVAWSPEAAKEITKLFTELKRKTRKFYPDLKEVDFLRELGKYSDNDIREAFDLERQDG